jgi:hypothetical protein
VCLSSSPVCPFSPVSLSSGCGNDWPLKLVWWYMSVILATQEAEIRRLMVQSEPRQIFLKPYLNKNLSQKKGWWCGSRYRPWVQTSVS